MRILALVLLLLPSACFQMATFEDSVSCSQNLGCQLLEGDVLCTPGEANPVPELNPVLALTQLKTRNKIRCLREQDCIPCVQVILHLGLLDKGPGKTTILPRRYYGSTEDLLQAHILLSAQTLSSSFSRCVAVKVWLPHAQDWHNGTTATLQFDCFPVALRGELHVTAFTSPHYQSMRVLQRRHYGPNCTWPKAKGALPICQVPRLKVFMGLEEAVLEVLNITVGQSFDLRLYWNQTREPKGLGGPILLTGPKNVSIPVSNVLPCLCLQVWSKAKGAKDSPRTHLCPFASDAEAMERAWTQSRLDLKVFDGTLSCSLTAPCDLPGELVPCWKEDPFVCHPLHPKLNLALTPHEPQEFPGIRPHPNLCVQVRSNGRTYLQSCLQEDTTEIHQPNGQQQLLIRETLDSEGSLSFHVLEQSTWVPFAQAVATRNGVLEEALKNDMQSGECLQVWHREDSEATILWTCSVEKYCRTHWALAWMVTLLGVCCLLLVLLLKKEALKGWLRILKEDYNSGEVLQGRHILILYSPDHAGFEHLVGTLAGALAHLQLVVSLELWSRSDLGSLGPMQWLHAQRRQVLQEGGTVLLLFSKGAVAGCAKWLGCGEKGTSSCINPNSTFLASLNCILPDFLAGKARDRYMVACFEKLLQVDEIPELFRSVPVYSLPTQVFNFLLALAGPSVGHEQRSRLSRHAVWISKSLERAVQDCQRKKPS